MENKHKFTDKEVIKALETAIKTGDAPIGVHWACTISKQGAKDALDLIKRQKAEIERLNILINGAKTKTVGKFVPRDYIQLTIDDMESET